MQPATNGNTAVGVLMAEQQRSLVELCSHNKIPHQPDSQHTKARYNYMSHKCLDRHNQPAKSGMDRV